MTVERKQAGLHGAMASYGPAFVWESGAFCGKSAAVQELAASGMRSGLPNLPRI